MRLLRPLCVVVFLPPPQGCALLNSTIYTLTWRESTYFKHGLSALSPAGSGSYQTTTGEGWGITTNPSGSSTFLVSDGSSYLHLCDASMSCASRIKVSYNGKAVRHVNELESWGGEGVLANVWYSDTVLLIDAETGNVRRTYDFSGLYPKEGRGRGVDCFNGIAWVEGSTFLVTGKLWPSMYYVELDAP